MGPEIDSQFREIARERTERRPLRTYLEIPFLRTLVIWFTPRVELLPVSARVWPLREEWEKDRADLLATITLVAINAFYLALAIWGAWLARDRPGWALLVVFILVRTIFFSIYVEAPEPRYVLECFPAIIALAAQPFARRAGKSAFFNRLRMNRKAENLGKAFFHAIFECGCNVVDVGDGKAAVHRAMARN